MRTFSLEQLKRDGNQEKLYNIFQTTVVDDKPRNTLSTVIEDGEEMRLDKVSFRLYGSREFVEELMVLNNIINPWSIKVGDEIQYLENADLSYMRESDVDLEKESNRKKLINTNKNTKKDPSRSNNLNPAVKPKNLKAIDVNKDNKKITIINKFE